MPQTFTSFQIDDDPLNANRLRGGIEETVTVLDGDGFLEPYRWSRTPKSGLE